MGIHRVELLDSFCLEDIQVDVVEDLQREGLLLGVRFKLHRERHETWWSYLGWHVGSDAADVVRYQLLQHHGACLHNLARDKEDTLGRVIGKFEEHRTVLLGLLVVYNVLSGGLSTHTQG